MGNRILYYATADNRIPVEEWLENLRDVKAQANVLRRIERIKNGNFGSAKPCREGVFELTIDFGPGFRVYYSKIESTVVLLLCAGDKSTQDADIKRAVAYLNDFRERAK